MAIYYKCPHCDKKCRQKEELKQHIISRHQAEINQLAAKCRKRGTINWAAGMDAAYSNKENPNKDINKHE